MAVVASKPVVSLGANTRAAGWSAVPLLMFAVSLMAGPAPTISAPAVLVPGESLTYVLEYRSRIVSQSAGPIYTSGGAHRLDISVGVRMRLDVLGVRNSSPQGRLTRLRVTYESCDASVHSDAYDPGAEALEKEYRALQGRSFEFTVNGLGRVGDLRGLDQIEPNEGARNAIRRWLSTITLPLGVWKPGLKPGKKWSRVVPLTDAPLAGLAWHTHSTYRDNETCPRQLSSSSGTAPQTCAVITTRLETVRNNPRGNPTPLSYRRKGLKTSGSWTASGESLSYISLSSGLVASSTATENDTINLTISSTLSGSRLHYAAREQSNSQMALVGVRFAGKRPPGNGPSHSQGN